MKPFLTMGLCALSLVTTSTVSLGSNPDVNVSTSLPVGTCINMGNMLEAPEEGSWGGKRIDAEDFARIKAAGFDTVRIPVRWHNMSSQTPPYAVVPAWMDRVQEVVDLALAADLNVILNSHHFDPIHEDPLAVSAWHGAVWKQIADRFAGYPDETLWFELENEPHKNFDHSNLLETLEPAYKAVRAKHPTRAIIYGGENWSGIDSLATLPMPDDPNVHPTFHYYDPFAFTHQGATWVGPDAPPVGRTFPSEADRAQLAKDVEKIRTYIGRTGKTPFMGESGAIDGPIATADRATYHRTVREAFAATGIGICVWAYANTFPFWNSEDDQWLPGMRAALGLPED